jgi:hypothetical protein
MSKNGGGSNVDQPGAARSCWKSTVKMFEVAVLHTRAGGT